MSVAMNSRIINNIIKSVENRKEEIINLTRELIRIRSENPPGDITNVAFYVKEYLEKNGFSVRPVEPEKGRISLISVLGDGTPTLIFNGHLDTVPAGDPTKWDVDPYSGTLINNFIYGRGASDMKAAIAGFIVSFLTLQKYEKHLNGKLKLIIVPDEESGGTLGTKYLLENNLGLGDYVLIGEPTGLELIEIGHKGALWIKLKAYGIPSHGALSPYVGESAILKIIVAIQQMINTLIRLELNIPSEILSSIDESTEILNRTFAIRGAGEKILKGITFNVGIIKGGQKINVIPDYCEAEVDVRFPPGISKEDILAKVRDLLKELKVDYEIIGMFDAGYTSPNVTLVRELRESVKMILNINPFLYITWATGDSKYYRSKGIPVVNYGPGREGVHEYNERVKVEDIINATKVYAVTAYRMLSGSRRSIL
ncbi:MAG: ArgE/DapE family deacylase [Desulfurococcaceae archaeon]